MRILSLSCSCVESACRWCTGTVPIYLWGLASCTDEKTYDDGMLRIRSCTLNISCSTSHLDLGSGTWTVLVRSSWIFSPPLSLNLLPAHADMHHLLLSWDSRASLSDTPGYFRDPYSAGRAGGGMLVSGNLGFSRGGGPENWVWLELPGVGTDVYIESLWSLNMNL